MARKEQDGGVLTYHQGMHRIEHASHGAHESFGRKHTTDVSVRGSLWVAGLVRPDGNRSG